mgnify:CR=1 FL=1
MLRALKIGFKDIKLVGIDLFTSAHFYHNSDLYPELRKIRGAPTPGLHKTAETSRAWSAPVFLETLIGMREQYDFEIFAFHKSGTSVLLPEWIP